MSYDQITTGAVLRYPYLWRREADGGETEGRKRRPTVVGFRLARPRGGDVLLLFPITTKEPSPERFCAEIPEIEKRRAGLDGDLRLWIILDEFNEDSVERSFYLEPTPPLGRLGRAFLAPLMRAFIERRRGIRPVRRHE